MVELQITNLFTEDVYFTLGIASFPADCLSDLNGTYTENKGLRHLRFFRSDLLGRGDLTAKSDRVFCFHAAVV